MRRRALRKRYGRAAEGFGPPGSGIAPAYYRTAYKLLEQYAAMAAHAQRASHLKAGRRLSTFRFSPPEVQRDLIDALNKGRHPGQEERAKGLMFEIRDALARGRA